MDGSTCGTRLVDALTASQIAECELANCAHSAALIGANYVDDEQAVRPGRVRIDLRSQPVYRDYRMKT